nr:uncharacterized mitochondrial protein AtMg00810-like [Tanacetum cinerariifolium]
GKKVIRTKWVYRNKKDQRGIVVRNKVRLVAQGHRQEEGIDYDEVYVDNIFFGSIKKSLCDEFKALMYKRFQMSSMGELIFFLGLQVKQSKQGIFISQDKYVAEILKKFDFSSVKRASTPIETQKPLVKDKEVADVDVHLYRSMIGSLMYLTASRSDIMFRLCACSRFQVTPKLSHLHAMKRIIRYLKGQPKLGLWYPKDSPFNLEAYSDSDYARANLDRISIIRGCQFLGRRLISWQCKKQTIVATSTTEAEDLYEKKLIQVLKIHTDDNVADLLTKDFDAATTASLDAQRDSSNITKTQSKATLNEPTPQGEGSGSSLRCQETMGGVMAQIRSEGALIQSIDLPLSTGFHPFRAGISKRHSLGRRKVSKHKRKNLKSQQMFQDIDDVLDEDVDIKMIVEAKGKGKGILKESEPVKKTKKKDQDQIKRDVDVALKIQADLDEKARTERKRQEEASKASLAEIYDEAIHKEGSNSLVWAATTASLDAQRDSSNITKTQSKATLNEPTPQGEGSGKGKGILQESEPVKKTKKKDQDQIERDVDVALKIQADLDEEARTERKRQEEASKASLAEIYDEV